MASYPDLDCCARCGDVFPDSQACDNCITIAEHLRAAAAILVNSPWLQAHLPLWLANWIWTWCVRCDRIVTRWHYNRCPCILLTPEPGSPLAAALERLIERRPHG